jgi:hypothetical protein
MNTSQRISRAGTKPALIVLKISICFCAFLFSAVIAKGGFFQNKNFHLKDYKAAHFKNENFKKALKNSAFKNSFFKTFQDTLQDRTADTLLKKQDTLAAVSKESVVISVDTVFSTPLHQHGSIAVLQNISFKNINKRDIGFQAYVNTAEILTERLPAYQLDLGNYGGFNHLAFFGGTPRNTGARLNGRLLTDPALGAFPIEQFSPETFENAEILLGANAAIIGGDAGTTINFQETRHNTSRPFTRIWFAQGGYDFSSSDGVFSQNFLKNWNGMVGYRKLSANGHYSNASLDAFQIRAGLRWSPGDHTTISLTDYFSNHFTGTNGGINPAQSTDIFDDLRAVPFYNYLDERAIRHDATLSFTTLLKDDSTSAVSGSLYGSFGVWDKGRSREFAVTPADTFDVTARFVSNHFGIRGQFEQKLGAFTFKTGGEAEMQKVTHNVYTDALDSPLAAGFFHAVFKTSDLLSLYGGGRIQLQQEKVLNFVGGGADFIFNAKLSLKLDASRSERLAGPTENLHLAREEHLLGLAILDFKSEMLNISLTAFARNITNPVLARAFINDSTRNITSTEAYSGESRRIFGGIFRGSARFKSLTLLGMLQSNLSSTNAVNDDRFPLLYGKIGAQYEYRVGQSVAIGGANLTLLSSFKGERFIPQTWSYIPADEESPFAANAVDVFVSAHLGNAYVKLQYMNLLNSGYYFVPYYPVFKRNFRLSVAWSFFE